MLAECPGDDHLETALQIALAVMRRERIKAEIRRLKRAADDLAHVDTAGHRR